MVDADATRERRRHAAPSDEEHRALRRDHPVEEPQKSYHTIVEQQVEQATAELELPATALLLSALTAGLDLGFGPFAMAVNTRLSRDVFSRPVQELLNANLYAVGFIFVVLGRSALFTEHTTSAVLPVLARRTPAVRLLRLWALVLAANGAGGALVAWFGSVLGPALGVADSAAFGELAHRVVGQPSSVMFLSAVGAGWLMGLLAWLATAARDTVSQIIVVWLTTAVIGLAGLHHSIAGTWRCSSAFSSGRARRLRTSCASSFGRCWATPRLARSSWPSSSTATCGRVVADRSAVPRATSPIPREAPFR